MYRRHGDKLGLVFLACDLGVTAAAWVGAYWLRFSGWPSPTGVPEFSEAVRPLAGVLLLAAVAYRVCGLYEIHRLRQLPRELGTVVRAAGLLFLLVITLTFYRRDGYESRLALGAFLVLDTAGLVLVRRVLWAGLKCLRRRGLNYGRAVVIGTGRTARRVAQTLQDNTWTGLELVGFVDEPDRAAPSPGPLLGSLAELPQMVADQNIDHVFIALPLRRYGDLPEIYRVLADLLVEVQLVPDVPTLAGMKLNMLEIDGTVFVGCRQSPHYGLGRLAKRALDLVLATAALLIFAPVMALLAVLIKLTSPGPILYRQTRIGLGGRPFTMLKFRSMRVNAEAQTGPIWARPQDDRCTPIGRFMRRWSLDELPQLFNVLAGHMSLVGPRPERTVFVEQFRQQLPGYQQRHQVKAGMTGWAQVHGWRGRTSLRRRIECDLYYVAHWSIWLDLKILAMTLWRGLRHKNAY